MKVPYDVVLPQVSVLGSTMAYREAGNPDATVALFCTGTRPRRTYGCSLALAFTTCRRIILMLSAPLSMSG
jgi:hypothetical protein